MFNFQRQLWGCGRCILFSLLLYAGPLTLSLDASGTLLIKTSQTGEAIASVEAPQPVHYVQLQKLFVPSYTTGTYHLHQQIRLGFSSFQSQNLNENPTPVIEHFAP